MSRRLTRRSYSIGVEPDSVCPLTHSNMNISAASQSITTKFYLKLYWDRRKASLCFWPDRIRTQVSMATYSPLRVIMGENLVATLAPLIYIGSSSLLRVRRTTISSGMSLNFGQI